MYSTYFLLCPCRKEEQELIASSGSKFRQFAFDLVESRWFSFSILAVIMFNTLFIAIQTSKYVVAKAGRSFIPVGDNSSDDAVVTNHTLMLVWGISES